MEALLLQDGVYVNDRYELLQEERRQLDRNQAGKLTDECMSVTASSELCGEERHQLEQWRIVERAKALDAEGPTSQLNKKFSVLQDILEKLYTKNEADLFITSPSNGPLKRLETDANSPVPFKELPMSTQVVLKMFFRTCQSLRDPTKLAVNSRLSVQIANKLPTILTTMPPCVLSPGLVDDVQVGLEDGGNIWSVFYQLFQLFEELLGLDSGSSSSAVRVCLSANDRATVIVAYVALSLKWGRLSYLMKGVRLLLENANELDGTRFEPLQPLFHELAATLVERPQVAFGEEEQSYGYLMSFGKGDHGKLGHGQCVHVSCQEGNCTENKMSPTMIAATRDTLFRKIDSLSTHSIAITAKGEAMAWGNGDKYRLGHGSSTKEYTPRTIEFLNLKGRVRDLACGLGHTMALMESGELFTWGNGSNGRLGLGDTNDRSSPTKVVVPISSKGKEADGGSESNITSIQVRFRHIFCGASHSLGISWDGRAYAWGKNNQGQCGHGHTNDQWTIQEIENFRDNEDGEEECITYAAGGWEHTLFCTASGRVYSCGCGYKDSRRAGIPPVLGHGDCDRRLKPTLVQALDEAREEIIKVACGWDHSLAVSANGKVYTWGSGTNGKLGHGDEESFDIPTLVRSMDGRQIKDAKAGCEHTVFLTHDHELWTCGQGDSGRLGHGDNQTRKRPTKIELFAELGLKPVALAVGDKYNLILVKDNDGQYELESEPTSIQKTFQPVEKNAGVYISCHGTANVLHSRRYKEQHNTHHESQEKEFGANWVLNVAAGIDPHISSAATSTTSRGPDSATSVALFIAGHVDRLASDYISDEHELAEKYEDLKGTETQSKTQKTVVLPFTTDTSFESMQALLSLLQLTTSFTSSKEKAMRSGSDSSSELFLGTQERMGLALSCLRILQLNLKKSLGTFHSPVQIIGDTSSGLIDLFGHIRKFLDSLAGLTGEDAVSRFDNGIHRAGSTEVLSPLGGAITHEAACALKMGFGIFYLTGSSRCKLLWEILDDCKVGIPSMRTIILSDQLCKDSIMTEIFRNFPTYGLVSLSKEHSGDVHNESITRKSLSDIKTLMIVLLKRSSAEAIKHLGNEAFSDFTSKPDCFLRLLHVLQIHYFSIAHRSATREDHMNERCCSKDQIQWKNEIMDPLLEYVDALMTESLAVLKTLHKGSRQHDEIITWRLNGSFFHTLLPSAIECLSVLLLPMQRERTSKSSVTRTTDNLLLVHRVLPNLHVMLKMLDEVSWKMHSANDSGNQIHDDGTFPHQTGSAQERNWFVDLGDACAVLCGKLSCELFYPPTSIAIDDIIMQYGMYHSLVLTEGRLLREEHVIVFAADVQISNSISSILKWEHVGVFEVEDEFVGCKDDVNTSGSIVSSEYQQFLLQFSEADYSIKPLSFWSWVAGKLSDVAEFTTDTERLLTIILSVSSWHLGLSEELHHVHKLYDTESQRATAIESIAQRSGIWRVLATLLCATKHGSWIYNSIDVEVMTNATKLSRLLLNLRPNPTFVSPVFRHEQEVQHADSFWECSDDSLLEMFRFLTKYVDVDTIQRSLAMKEVHGALLRTGICILHDLLRKLTTSSTKSCLLDEFVAVTCGTHRSRSTPVVSIQKVSLSRENGNDINKAIENLFVRLARIVSSEDASFDLKKKALMAWTVPLSAKKRDIPCVVALIAKAGIMSTSVELLLDEANVLDGDINASTQSMILDNQDSAISQFESRQLSKVSPMKTLLFDQTPAQVISVLAWEVFCAIAMQLSKSEHFAEHKPNMLLRAAGSSLHEREPLTPRSISMSPRRRLTLPKKMIISSIDEIIEQMTDGLFLMLKGVKTRLEALDTSSKEFKTLFKPTKEVGEITKRSVQQNLGYPRVFLLGHPVQVSHSISHGIGISKLKDVGNTTENATSLSLAFWIYVERTGVLVSKTTLDADDTSFTNSRPKESSVRLCAFSTDHVANSTPESTDALKDGSVIVFTRDAYPDHVSLGVSIKCGGDTDGSWCSIFVDEYLPRRKWAQVVLGFDEERPEQLQVFVGARRSTLNNGQQSVNNCKNFCLKFLQHANSWTQLTTGGNIDVDALTNSVRESNTESLRLSILQKKNVHGFTSVLDDVVITRGVLAEEMVIRMQINGPVLFRLKQQHVAESHCVKVLRLLWQLVDPRENSSREVPLTRLSPSGRWIALFSRMLLSTTCTHDQALAQMYLCNLLADVLPRASPPPEFDIQSLGQELFSTRQMKFTSVEELFTMFNGQMCLSSASTIRRQNEILYRTMQQHGMLHGSYRGGDLSENDEMLALKQKTSIRCAAAVHLFQALLRSASWGDRMDQFVGSLNTTFHYPGGWKEIIYSEEIHSEENNTLRLTDMIAVVTTLAGYSEEVVNAHRAAVYDATILPSSTQAWNFPFDSVIHFDDSNANQTVKVQELVRIILREETRQALCLPPRKDILVTCHNDVVVANAVDVRIGTLIHQRARVLRVLMTALLREKNRVTTNSWHDFLLENTPVCDDLLKVSSLNMKEYVTMMLGVDAKIAMKLRRVRIFIKEVLHGGRHRRGVPLVVSVADLECLQWQLWEETTARLPSTALIPWWQQSSESYGMDIVGGEVELCDLKVKALEHFPTVKLSQVNICANSGLWFFEVVILTDGLMQIGYVDGDFAADPLQGQGVGDHTNSWAFDGFRCKKWNGNSFDYGEQWKADDVVGVLLDTDRMEISYYLNGKFLGVAFSGISITANSRMCPAASLNVHQSAEFNFGTPSATSLNEGGMPTSGVCGFKYMPVLDNEDQARLRCIATSLQTRRTSRVNGSSSAGNPEKEETKENDTSEEWSSTSSSDSDTDDGEIVLEGTDSLSELRRNLELGSQDGRETSTTDQYDEEIGQRRRDLVEGLTGLGFPLEWATRCATEARLPTDETGAAAWISEQMEKVGLEGTSRLPIISTVNGDGGELPSQPIALWSTHVQLPNVVASHLASNLTANVLAFAGTGISNTLERLNDIDIPPGSEPLSIPTYFSPISSLSDKFTTTSGPSNVFIDADRDDQQSDDAANEAFQAGGYRHKQIGLQLSKNLSEDSKRSVDDLVPLSIVVDTTLFVAYARQSFTSLLLLVSREEKQEGVYRMLRRLVSSEESSARLHRCLRIAVGLDTMDASFEMGYISESIRSSRSLQLQKVILVLLKHETKNTLGEAENSGERYPLLNSFCQEMVSQCERGLGLVRAKQSGKTVSNPLVIQSAAAWFAWVAGIVIEFVEDQLSEGSSLSTVKAGNRFSAYNVPPFSSTAFVEKLVTIASSTSSTSKVWKYVAFRLISRILLCVRADTASEFFAAVQLENLTDLFALRYRREMYNRVFFSDVTSTLFNLLVHSSASLFCDSKVDKREHSENQGISLRINNYSSTHVTISWDQTSCTTSSPIPAIQSDSVANEATSETRAEVNSTILFLDVTRCGPPHFGGVVQDGSNTNASKALPSKGTYTIRNLLPDTQYLIRLATQSQNDTSTGDSAVPSNEIISLERAEVIVQTPPDPVFELDRETMGKNLVVFNRNLTAKNTANKKWHSIRASVAFDEGVHTWQVRLDTCVSKNIFIGVCTEDASMENYVGSDAYGYGFLANKAVWHNKAKLHSYGEIFKQGDVIEVILDCNAKTLAFSRNGEYLGIAASDMRAGTSRSNAGGSTGSDGNCKWYPAFSMYNKDDKVTLIPPFVSSVFSTKEGRSQNVSTFDLIDAMHDVVAYQDHLTGVNSNRDLSSKLFEKAFEEFEDWRRGKKIFREISHGRVIAIDKSKSATDKYGLASGDSVFTSKGQCTVLGEYRHELWYEVDEGGTSSLFGTTSTQIASWSLTSCREMLESPDEYPVHRHHKYKLDMEDNTLTKTDSVIGGQDTPITTANEEMFSLKAFVDAQVQWRKSGTNTAEEDAKLIAELDAIASSQASSSAILLSFADVSTALLMERIYEFNGVSSKHESNHIIARIGLLLYVNRCLFNIVRVAMTRNTFATSLGTSESADFVADQSTSSKQVPTSGNTECCQVSPVAALLNSRHWTLDDPSAFTWMPSLAARLLFSSQKEKLIDEDLRTTKSSSRTLDSLKEPNDNEDGGVDSDLPVIKISYPLSRAIPFWECSSALLKKKSRFCMPLSTESSVFVQLAKQLTAQDARQWRRESSQPFEAIPISQTFQVHLEKPSTEPPVEAGKDDKNGQQQQDEDDEEQLQQPSSKQTARYLNIFENAVREIQSPCFPLFAPAHDTGSGRCERLHPLQLDVNVELFLPSAMARSRVQSSQLLLWYFCLGQVLGVAWRSKLLLPLQFLTRSFWEELVSPADPLVNEFEDESGMAREVAIRAIRDGLFSIIPSRCVALLSGNNPSLRDRLSDLDVNYVTRLERHATYSVPRQSHHESFWMTVNAFTSVERRMLEQFINPERRTGTKQVEVMSGTTKSSSFVLEIADALADGRDHPDSCYPVVVSIAPHLSRLHLPAYSSSQTLRNKLLLAMTNIPFM